MNPVFSLESLNENDIEKYPFKIEFRVARERDKYWEYKIVSNQIVYLHLRSCEPRYLFSFPMRILEPGHVPLQNMKSVNRRRIKIRNNLPHSRSFKMSSINRTLWSVCNHTDFVLVFNFWCEWSLGLIFDVCFSSQHTTLGVFYLIHTMKGSNTGNNQYTNQTCLQIRNEINIERITHNVFVFMMSDFVHRKLHYVQLMWLNNVSQAFLSIW